MKKTLFILLVVMLSSCATMVSNTAFVGMPISEFKTSAGNKARLEGIEYGYTVYKVEQWNPKSGMETKFFYFDSEGKLYKMDTGQFKQSRYQVEIINR